MQKTDDVRARDWKSKMKDNGGESGGQASGGSPQDWNHCAVCMYNSD